METKRGGRSATGTLDQQGLGPSPKPTPELTSNPPRALRVPVGHTIPEQAFKSDSESTVTDIEPFLENLFRRVADNI